MEKPARIRLPIPSWAGAVYLSFCVVLIPWTVYLSRELPRHHLSPHWDISWVGLDVGITIMLLLTAILAFKKSKWVAVTATAAGTILIVDAWFDIMTSSRGVDLLEAVVLAAAFELPIALMSFILAFRVLDRNLD